MNGKQKNSVSVVMTARNEEDYISTSIESVLNQSFSDFELIIVDDGSTDQTRSVIRSYKDKRIRLIDNEQDYILSLNKGLKASTGKYLARMDAYDIAHIDRLKIQHAIMEDNPAITVCCCQTNVDARKESGLLFKRNYSGIVEMPLVQLLFEDFVQSSSTMTRNAFIKDYHLFYEANQPAADYKFWVEAAKRSAVFYLESQQLVYKRKEDEHIPVEDNDLQKQATSAIRKDILEALCEKNNEYSSLKSFYKAYYEMVEQRLFPEEDVFKAFYALFLDNKEKLNST